MDYQEYIYITRDIEYTNWQRFITTLAGRLQRKSIFRVFCVKNGIDLPIEPGKRYNLPKDYLIESSRIEKIGVYRDKIILAIYAKYYRPTQLKLQNLILEKETKLTEEKKYRDNEAKKLCGFQKSLTKSTDNRDIIYYQNEIGAISTNLKNQDNRIDELDTEILALKRLLGDNIKAWHKQCELVDSATSSTMFNTYINSCTRKIIDKLGFSNFKYITPDYSKSVNEILKGNYE